MSTFGLPKISSPASVLSGSGVDNITSRDMSPASPSKMAIEPVSESFNVQLTTLLLNTNSVSEGKSANWVKHMVPGQSDPIMQWVNGTEKTISFTAMVTKDIASNFTVNEVDNADQWTLIITPELEERYANTGTLPAPILNNLTNASFKALTNTQKTNPQWSRSIQPQLDFYRRLLMPRQGATASSAVKTPPLVYLRMGTILGSRADVENQKYLLLSYNMNITEYTPELQPTKATVTFTFVEYHDKNQSFDPAKSADEQLRTQAIRSNSSKIPVGPKPIPDVFGRGNVS